MPVVLAQLTLIDQLPMALPGGRVFLVGRAVLKGLRHVGNGFRRRLRHWQCLSRRGGRARLARLARLAWLARLAGSVGWASTGWSLSPSCYQRATGPVQQECPASPVRPALSVRPAAALGPAAAAPVLVPGPVGPWAYKPCGASPDTPISLATMCNSSWAALSPWSSPGPPRCYPAHCSPGKQHR